MNRLKGKNKTSDGVEKKGFDYGNLLRSQGLLLMLVLMFVLVLLLLLLLLLL
jgi:hypothetical protein